ncbi:hypothetical protein E2C01_019439 [Portunus trituberculatus]|uniref:Uncharacterized protein n=1 Tax=Portunus trituberculatus TaxID=210409 RepID=A0A5B7E0F7_PORTR|nr:hypothetical protein [Portunus trituberculatus]
MKIETQNRDTNSVVKYNTLQNRQRRDSKNVILSSKVSSSSSSTCPSHLLSVGGDNYNQSTRFTHTPPMKKSREGSVKIITSLKFILLHILSLALFGLTTGLLTTSAFISSEWNDLPSSSIRQIEHYGDENNSSFPKH